eukprot:TRINITY_DN35214_c0_g1_i2.p1 TRINITY_DN35214_c0_g1~~TRINITY_DN35214_c0_g1_i2.p1  ORF type:complete len:158 (+),score=21.85 TRINITY_DN35214_c0_g1_i2:81-554(+)
MIEPMNQILVNTIKRELAIQSEPRVQQDRAEKLYTLYGGFPPDFKARAAAAQERGAGMSPFFKEKLRLAAAEREARLPAIGGSGSRTPTYTDDALSVGSRQPRSPALSASRRSAPSLHGSQGSGPMATTSGSLQGTGTMTLRGWAVAEKTFPVPRFR